ncbi:M23 family metallopeptidase [Xanthomonas melonis]
MPHRVLRRAILAGAGLSILASIGTLAAQQRWHWPTPTPGVPVQAPGMPRGPDTAMSPPAPTLLVEWQSPTYLVWATNPLAGPAQFRLSAPASDDYRVVPQLPVVAQLAAHERRLLARLYPAGRHRPTGGLGMQLALVPGDAEAQLQQAHYQLPFRDAPVRVAQGYGGPFSHHDELNWYAVDFALPRATPVLAARAGTVMDVQQGFDEDGPHGPEAGGGNLVRILHDDGSMAIYAHLAPDGIAVRSGQRVDPGARIGSSGNTGFSRAPHLHFSVQRNVGMRLISLPFRMSGPEGELQFPSPAP